MLNRERQQIIWIHLPEVGDDLLRAVSAGVRALLGVESKFRTAECAIEHSAGDDVGDEHREADREAR